MVGAQETQTDGVEEQVEQWPAGSWYRVSLMRDRFPSNCNFLGVSLVRYIFLGSGHGMADRISQVECEYD